MEYSYDIAWHSPACGEIANGPLVQEVVGHLALTPQLLEELIIEKPPKTTGTGPMKTIENH